MVDLRVVHRAQLYDTLRVLKDIKNGFIQSPTYGKIKEIMMEPPHVVVFAENEPDLDILPRYSRDRWKIFVVNAINSPLLRRQ